LVDQQGGPPAQGDLAREHRGPQGGPPAPLPLPHGPEGALRGDRGPLRLDAGGAGPHRLPAGHRARQPGARAAAMSTNGSRLPVLVVGVGHLGRQHARVYHELPDAVLAGVVDVDLDRAREVAEGLGVPAHDRLTPELLRTVQAASVVTPTPAHLEVAKRLIEAGVSVLVEKPMAGTLEEAREMIRLAESRSKVLQVGHIE